MRDTNQYGQIYKVTAAQETRKGGKWNCSNFKDSATISRKKTKLSFGGFFPEGRKGYLDDSQ